MKPIIGLTQDLVGSVKQGQELWRSLSSKWYELGFPGSPHTPNEFIVCLLLSHLHDAVEIEQVKQRISDGHRLFRQLVEDKVLPPIYQIQESVALLTMSLVVVDAQNGHVDAPAQPVAAVAAEQALELQPVPVEIHVSVEPVVLESPAVPELPVIEPEPVVVQEATVIPEAVSQPLPPAHIPPITCCPNCHHDFERCAAGEYVKQPVEREGVQVQTQTRVDAVVSTQMVEQPIGCLHVGKDNKCISCTEDEIITCCEQYCTVEIIESKARKCKNYEECGSAYCDDHNDEINEYGFCPDCSEVSCDGAGCDNEMERGSDVHFRCSNPECKSNEDFCNECASRLLNAQGLCPQCSGEEELQCSNCDAYSIVSKSYKCKNYDECGHVYCQDDQGQLNKYRYCSDCREVECADDDCSNTVVRGITEECVCSNPNCKNSYIYCAKCANRLFSAKGWCPDCSGEDLIECSDCGENWTSLKMTACLSGEDCPDDAVYCPNCKKANLDEHGRCNSCEE